MAYALAFLVSYVITLTAVFRSFVSMRFLLLFQNTGMHEHRRFPGKFIEF